MGIKYQLIIYKISQLSKEGDAAVSLHCSRRRGNAPLGSDWGSRPGSCHRWPPVSLAPCHLVGLLGTFFLAAEDGHEGRDAAILPPARAAPRRAIPGVTQIGAVTPSPVAGGGWLLSRCPFQTSITPGHIKSHP